LKSDSLKGFLPSKVGTGGNKLKNNRDVGNGSTVLVIGQRCVYSSATVAEG
jgi:hypothetical protein